MKSLIIGILLFLVFGTTFSQEAQIKYFPKIDTLIVDQVRRDSITIFRQWINALKEKIDSLDALEDSLLVYNSQFKIYEKMKAVEITGVVKFFNESKGYGFVIAHDSNDEYFIHSSKLNDSITKGDIIKFEAVETKKGKQAFNVRLV